MLCHTCVYFSCIYKIISNTDTRAAGFKESPKWVFIVPRRRGALQRLPCLLWYLSTCWKAAIRCPLGSLSWRMPNSPCQASINIFFVVIAHYANTVTCVGQCFWQCFGLFCFALSVALVMLRWYCLLLLIPVFLLLQINIQYIYFITNSKALNDLCWI